MTDVARTIFEDGMRAVIHQQLMAGGDTLGGHVNTSA
jgi:hypothetical protein